MTYVEIWGYGTARSIATSGGSRNIRATKNANHIICWRMALSFAGFGERQSPRRAWRQIDRAMQSARNLVQNRCSAVFAGRLLLICWPIRSLTR